MSKSLQHMREAELRAFVGKQLALVRTALGKRQMDWVREYPQFLTSAGKLANWEKGDYLPSPLFLMQLCDDHNLSMDFFYRGQSGGVGQATAQLLRRAKTSSSSRATS